MAKTQTEPGTTLAVRSSSDLAAGDEVLAELERVLVSNERVEPAEEDADKMASEIVAQILAAESDEELAAMQGGNTIGWRDLLGVPVELVGFRWRPSDYDEGASLYFVVFGVRLDTGEPVVLTTGSRNIMAQLVNRAKRGALSGAVVKATEPEKTTRAGFKPLWLVTVTPQA